MRLFFALVVLVAALKVLVNLGLFFSALWQATPNLPAEVSALLSLALLLGGAAHYARRATIVPPRPILTIAGVVLTAPLLALALAAPELRATWSNARFAFEAGFVLFQLVGLWTIGGIMFGGPFTDPSQPSTDSASPGQANR